MSELAIAGTDLGKRYSVYANPWDRFLSWVPGRAHSPPIERWAFRGVDLAVAPGQCLGVIGRNGAGKSTLLKVLTGVVQASTGSLDIRGKVLALLELGTGFNGELSGRDNVLLSGALLGYPSEVLEARMDAIRDFADIGEYFDRPVKTYSSGMYVRLAFSLYVNLEPEIFIVDEALSVGDFFFQQKCAAAMRAIKARDTTIVFVSHDASAVQELCDEVMLLEGGQVLLRADAQSAISRYHTLSSVPQGPVGDPSPGNSVDRPPRPRDPRLEARIGEIVSADLIGAAEAIGVGGARLLGLRIVDEAGQACSRFASGSRMRVECALRALQYIAYANIGLQIADDQDRPIWSAATSNQDAWFGSVDKGDEVVVVAEVRLDLPPGSYRCNVAVGEVDPYDASVAIFHDLRVNAFGIDIVASPHSVDRDGMIYLDMAMSAL